MGFEGYVELRAFAHRYDENKGGVLYRLDLTQLPGHKTKEVSGLNRSGVRGFVDYVKKELGDERKAKLVVDFKNSPLLWEG